MFESVEPSLKVRASARAVGFVVSLAAHLVAIGGIVLLPLLLIRILPGADLLTWVMEPPPPPAPVPPVPPGEREHTRVARPVVVEGGFVQPNRIPESIPVPPDESTLVGPGPIGIDIGPGSPFGVHGTPLGPTVTAATPPPVPLPKPPPPKRAAQRVGGAVQESKLIRRVDPVYPDLAKRARVSGVVILEVTVDEEGSVAKVLVLRGQPLLDDAAVTAVSQWRYSPTLLNGEPVPVIATVTVIFTLR